MINWIAIIAAFFFVLSWPEIFHHSQKWHQRASHRFFVFLKSGEIVATDGYHYPERSCIIPLFVTLHVMMISWSWLGQILESLNSIVVRLLSFPSLIFKALSFPSLEFSKPACNELAAQKRRLASSRQSQRQIPRQFERRQNLASTRTWFQSKLHWGTI